MNAEKMDPKRSRRNGRRFAAGFETTESRFDA
jgi:hypothetical protein